EGTSRKGNAPGRINGAMAPDSPRVHLPWHVSLSPGMTMSFRTRTTAAVLSVLALGALTPAIAQPIVPQRPTYGAYFNLFRPGGESFYFGNGYASPNYQLQLQNQLLQQQLNFNNQSIADLQTYLTTAGVNPNLPITGRGATFHSLGHWYPQARNGGGGGGAI